MPKAMFVISGLGAGGAERVVSQIASHWQTHGVEVGIASFDRPEDAEFHHFDAEITRHRLGRSASGQISGKLSKFHNLIDLRRLLRKEAPDVVIPFLTKNNLITLLASRGTGIPVVCCERNNPEQQQKHPAWNALLSAAYGRARLIVCQTEAVKRCFPKEVSQRLRVIPNPVSAWPKRRRTTEANTIVAVGRLNEQKGFDVLIEAFAEIAAKAEDWQLLIYGDGPLRGALEAQIAGLGLAEQVKLMGTTDTPGAWVEGANLFVLSSRYEGFPNVLGEAMAAGLPIIATDCDFGPAEMIEHARSGLLVPPGDAAALARAMEQCVESADLRKQLGNAAARAIRKFAPEWVMQQWDAVLAEALSSRAPAPEPAMTKSEEPAQ